MASKDVIPCQASGSVTTSGNVTSTVCTIPVNTLAGFARDNCAFYVEAVIVGASGGGNGAMYKICAGFRKISGTLTQIGATTLIASFVDAALGASSYVLDAPDNNTIRLRATGVTSATIPWTGQMQLTTSPF